MPSSVKEICDRTIKGQLEAADEYKVRPTLFKAFRAAADDPASRGEPSWSALATLLEDATFVQVARRLAFWGNSFDELPPIVADHPQAKLLDIYSPDRKQATATAEEAQDMDLHPLSFNAITFCDSMVNIRQELYRKPGDLISRRADDVYRDQWRLMERYRGNDKDYFLINKLRHIAPNMPITIAGLLAQHHDLAEPHFDDWKQRYGEIPDIQTALVRYYQSTGKPDDALQQLQQEIQEHPSRDAYLKLADAYLNKNDEERWLATLDEYFEKVPNAGLEHAQTANLIAEHFMRQRRWQQARPYAEKAAESGSEWGLDAAASCAEALQDWTTAEDDFSTASQRYAKPGKDWYWFCRRTGFGNLLQSQQLIEQALAQYDPKQQGDQAFYFSAYLSFDRQFDRAYKLIQDYIEHSKKQDVAIWFQCAILADRTGDSVGRDELLKKILNVGPFMIDSEFKRPDFELISLAQLIADDLAAGGKGDIDFEEAKRRSVSIDPNQSGLYYFLLREYFDNHSQPEKAVECWKRAMLCPQIRSTPRSLSAARLAEHQVPSDDYRQELQNPLSDQEISPPPAAKPRVPPDAALFQDRYYLFVPLEKSWTDAKAAAETAGGQLASITSEDQQTFIAGLCDGKIAWLGGHRDGNEWKWESGETFEYKNWFRDNIAQPHLRMLATGKWGGGLDQPNAAAGFVCEWPK